MYEWEFRRERRRKEGALRGELESIGWGKTNCSNFAALESKTCSVSGVEVLNEYRVSELKERKVPRCERPEARTEIGFLARLCFFLFEFTDTLTRT